ncbi:MAG: hypothetical protein H0W82_02235 [Actinobacteria bacterium]|nr:hypothetical protein [Actinomycetota bacterium]
MTISYDEEIQTIALLHAVSNLGTPWTVNLSVGDAAALGDDLAQVYYVAGSGDTERGDATRSVDLTSALGILLDRLGRES